MVKAVILMPEGFEDIEAIAVIDILRRAGIDLKTAGVNASIIKSASGMKVYTDIRLVDVSVNDYDALILPGGNPGYLNLMNHSGVIKLIREFSDKGKILAAICGGPMALNKAGVVKDKRVTAYPGFEKEFDMPRSDPVVVDGNIITSQGPGTAIKFALAIVEKLSGSSVADKVRKHILV